MRCVKRFAQFSLWREFIGAIILVAVRFISFLKIAGGVSLGVSLLALVGGGYAWLAVKQNKLASQVVQDGLSGEILKINHY